MTPDELRYKLDLSTLQVSEHSIESELVNTANNIKFKFTLTAIVGNTFRVVVDEINSLHPRYKVSTAFKDEPQVSK